MDSGLPLRAETGVKTSDDPADPESDEALGFDQTEERGFGKNTYDNKTKRLISWVILTKIKITTAILSYFTSLPSTPASALDTEMEEVSSEVEVRRS